MAKAKAKAAPKSSKKAAPRTSAPKASTRGANKAPRAAAKAPAKAKGPNRNLPKPATKRGMQVFNGKVGDTTRFAGEGQKRFTVTKVTPAKPGKDGSARQRIDAIHTTTGRTFSATTLAMPRAASPGGASTSGL